MSLFRRYVVWENYFSASVASYEGHELILKQSVEAAEGRARAQAKGSTTERRFVAQGDPGVISAQHAAASAKRDLKSVVSTMENVNRSGQFLSRELTRRIGRDPFERRTSNFGGA